MALSRPLAARDRSRCSIAMRAAATPSCASACLALQLLRDGELARARCCLALGARAARLGQLLARRARLQRRVGGVARRGAPRRAFAPLAPAALGCRRRLGRLASSLGDTLRVLSTCAEVTVVKGSSFRCRTAIRFWVIVQLERLDHWAR
jgi:hypothetical protein